VLWAEEATKTVAHDYRKRETQNDNISRKAMYANPACYISNFLIDVTESKHLEHIRSLSYNAP